MRRVWVCGVALAWSVPALAGDKPLYAPAPDWVVPAPPLDVARLREDSPALLVLDNQQRLNGDTVAVYTESVIRAQSAELLAQMGTIAIPWMPDKGDLTIHRAEILRGGERIDLLARGGERFTVLRREAQLEQRMLNGMLTATMAAEGLRTGDMLRLAFTVTQRDPALKGKVQTIAPALSEPFRAAFARSRMSWPKDMPVVWKRYPDGPKETIGEAGGYRTVEFAMPLPKAAELPADAPPRYRRPPIVEATSFASWSDVSRTMAPLYATEGLIAPGGALAGEVARIGKSSADPLHRANAALQLVQGQVRYLLMGMNGGNYVPQSPAQTWELRYGDCKAKSLLLLAMLRAMDIPAEAMLVSIEQGDALQTRLPMPGAFDHVVVRAEIGGRAYWLDGTRLGADISTIGNVPPFRYALPLRPDGADLVSVPSVAQAQPDVVVSLDLDQSAGLELPVPFTMAMKVRGEAAGALNLMATQAAAQQKRQFAAGMARSFVGDAQIADATIGYDAATSIGTVTISGITGTRWRREQGRYRMVLDRLLGEASFEPDRSRASWRDIPVATGAPEANEFHTSIRLPGDGAAYRLDGQPGVMISFAGQTINRSAAFQGGTLKVDERSESTGAEIPADAIGAERRKLGLAKARLLTAIAPADVPKRWQIVPLARRNGGFRTIEDVFGKVIAADPDDIDAHQSRVNYRLGIWDYKAALADLTRMLSIEGTSDTYLRRSSVYEALGDRAKALADAREAHKLAPDSDGALNRVAYLVAAQGDSKSALAMLKDRIDLGGTERFDAIALQADILADSGDVAGGIAALDEAIVERPGDAMLLNNRCWMKATRKTQLDTALKDCTKAIELAESPAAALDSRAMVYFRMDRMDDALADLEAALDIAPNMAASLFMRGVIRKRTGAVGGDEDLAGARLISPGIDQQFKRYGITI